MTTALHRAAAGDERAGDDLLPLVYNQLRAIAQRQMNNEQPGHTLQATALVHEAYARLIGDERLVRGDQRRFFACAAEAMQRILIEHARSRGRLKRGGNLARLPLDVVDLAAECDEREIVALDGLVRRLHEHDPGAAEVVRLRFYAGLSVEQTATALGLSERTVKREWQFARAWLYRQLEAGPEGIGTGS